jgi:membrane fusion protein, adhesin transport system
MAKEKRMVATVSMIDHGHARHHFAPHPIDRVKSPRASRGLFRVVLALFIATPFALLFLPWQQTVQGKGRVIAFDPTHRQQIITARVSGQISSWKVVENQEVKRGDLLVEIEDNDPDLADRLKEQRKFLQGRKFEAEREFKEQERVVAEQKLAMDASVKAATKNADASRLLITARQKSVAGANARVDYAKEQYTRFEKLFREDGARSLLEMLRAKADLLSAQAEVDRMNAEIEQQKATVEQNESLISRAQADGHSAVALAQRQLNVISQTLFGTERDLQEIENRIQRFEARYVYSPVDGYIFRVEANVGSGGAFVKEGDTLAVIIPKTEHLVVELLVDGNDTILIQKEENGRYPHVRLQFEGWPAFQFSGWPSVSHGTFGGRVIQVDATDNGLGQFRVLVEPDEHPNWAEEDNWPSREFLRQGNKAVGWVFLQQVSLGWEIWRQLNGFSPVVASMEPGKEKKKK